jgi:hypothetical protein
MASIHERKDCGGRSFRVQIRRVGVPYFSMCFDTLQEAGEWVRDNEEEYVRSPEEYQKFRERQVRLHLRREREFQRKKTREGTCK